MHLPRNIIHTIYDSCEFAFDGVCDDGTEPNDEYYYQNYNQYGDDDQGNTAYLYYTLYILYIHFPPTIITVCYTPIHLYAYKFLTHTYTHTYTYTSTHTPIHTHTHNTHT
jgi:hypothetical protein